MLEREENELLQDYRYRRNILQEIKLDDIEKWNNMDVDVDWDKITNKPTTLEGYGITDVYTKDEIQDNTLNKFKAINGKVLVDTGFNLGLKDGDNLISYNYGTSGAPTLKLGVHAYISSYMSNMDIVAPTQLMLKTDNLNLKTKLLSLQGNYGSFSVDVSDNKANNKLYASIPAEFTDIVKAPRINIYSGNNTVLEGALWNSTYNINGAIKDGLHLSHENGKYLALAYKNASTGIYNSYMILDVEGVLRNDSDGDDWGPVRFEQNVFFRHGLKIGGGEDIILAGKGVNTRITALENAISQGTGMVEWNNVLNKPSTFTPSSHKHAISDITSLQSALDGKLSTDNGLITTQYGCIILSNTQGYLGKDKAGATHVIGLIGNDNYCYLGGNLINTYIRSKNCPQYLDPSGNKYNIYHSGNFNPSNYLPLSGGNLTGDLILNGARVLTEYNYSSLIDIKNLKQYTTLWSDANNYQWAKIADINVSNVNGVSAISFVIHSSGSNSENHFAIVVANIKQVNAMGTAPQATLYMPLSKNLPTNNVIGIITMNTSTKTTMTIYAKIPTAWSIFSCVRLTSFGIVNMYEKVSLVTSLPSGTQIAVS